MFTAAANFAASAMRAMPGGASMMAGFTLMKRTVARGRTRGARTQAGAAKQEAQQDENAIMISTAGGCCLCGSILLNTTAGQRQRC